MVKLRNDVVGCILYVDLVWVVKIAKVYNKLDFNDPLDVEIIRFPYNFLQS